MNAALPSLDARRAQALEVFRAKGVPHRRVEEWKYSDLHAALEPEQVARAGAIQWQIASAPPGIEIFDLARANPPEWVARNLGTASAGAMASASLAFARGGVALRVPRNEHVKQAVRIAFASHGNGRALVVVEEGARLTLVESHAAGEGLRNLGVEIVLAPRARLDHVRVAASALAEIQVETIAVQMAPGAHYRAHYANMGAKLSRLDVRIDLRGEGGQAHLSGTTVLGDGAHADVTTYVDHASGNTTSTQLFRNVAGGKSRAVYQGKIVVAPGANGSDSRQTAKGLLLGERAEIDLKPELEILADDVKCAHGAAIGDLDAESLFYLRSRGIAESEARNLLIRAFLEDAVAQIEDEAIRAGVWKDVEAALVTVAGAA